MRARARAIYYSLCCCRYYVKNHTHYYVYGFTDSLSVCVRLRIHLEGSPAPDDARQSTNRKLGITNLPIRKYIENVTDDVIMADGTGCANRTRQERGDTHRESRRHGRWWECSCVYRGPRLVSFMRVQCETRSLTYYVQ